MIKMSTEKRPKIKLEFTLTDKLMEIFGWLLVVLIWVIPLINYAVLPDTIPIHFDAAGKVDNFGSKLTIYLVPLIGTLLFVMMTIVNRFPHIFNYAVEITQENALRQYTNATKLIRYLKLALLVIFTLITVFTIRAAKGESAGLGIWFLPLTLAIVLIPTIYFIARMYKEK
jgi:uncharacterized membrane protein